MPSTTDPAKVSCKRPQSITYMVQQYATVTYLPAGQNTNKSPLQELPWPSKLTPKDDLPEMDACREILEKGLAYMSAVKSSRQVVQT
ncbi:hypothetical protein BFJ71_g14043 [Fusarium oxysporum]|nr:hypothetical protein BFJ71_g14043 [Fusarium oxysporum]